MSNTFLINSLIASESLAILTNNLVFSNKINRAYEDKFDLEVQGHRTGPTINIPKPARRQGRSGSWTFSAEDFTETSVPLTINTVKGDDTAFQDSDLALLISNPDNMEEWSKRFLKPRIVNLANQIDADLYAKAMVTVPYVVGVPGQTPASAGIIFDAMERLDATLTPTDDRTVLLNPKANNKVSESLKGLVYKPAEKALLRGMVSEMAGFDLFMSQTVTNQTYGAQGGTPQVNAGSQTGSSLVTKNWSNSISGLLNNGDIFTIAGVYQVNPSTKTVLPDLQQFVVTATAASDGSGNSTLSIYPSIITSGATQTVSASPAANAVITVVGSASTAYAQNLAFHKDFFTVAFAKLFTPKGTDTAVTKSSDGLSLRYIRDWDTVNSKLIDRLDVYYGCTPLYQDWGCRITG